MKGKKKRAVTESQCVKPFHKHHKILKSAPVKGVHQLQTVISVKGTLHLQSGRSSYTLGRTVVRNMAK